MAGFGTAGSLLACAAALFVIATGVVAFQGWPNLAGPTGPASIRLDLPRPGTVRPATARPVTNVAVTRRAPAINLLVPAPTAPSHREPHRGTPNGVLRSAGAGSVAMTATGATGTGGATVVNLHSTSDTGGVGAAGGDTVTPKPRRIISQVTTQVGKPVSTAASTAGSIIGGPVGSTVSGVPGAAGSAVAGVGNTAAGAVNGVASQVGAGASAIVPGR